AGDAAELAREEEGGAGALGVSERGEGGADEQVAEHVGVDVADGERAAEARARAADAELVRAGESLAGRVVAVVSRGAARARDEAGEREDRGGVRAPGGAQRLADDQLGLALARQVAEGKRPAEARGPVDAAEQLALVAVVAAEGEQVDAPGALGRDRDEDRGAQAAHAAAVGEGE